MYILLKSYLALFGEATIMRFKKIGMSITAEKKNWVINFNQTSRYPTEVRCKRIWTGGPEKLRSTATPPCASARDRYCRSISRNQRSLGSPHITAIQRSMGAQSCPHFCDTANWITFTVNIFTCKCNNRQNNISSNDCCRTVLLIKIKPIIKVYYKEFLTGTYLYRASNRLLSSKLGMLHAYFPNS